MSGSEQAGPYLKAGTKVRYDGTGEPEYGIVLHCWYDTDGDFNDCYVAFFGDNFPDPARQPTEKPYVLRYSSQSLSVLD